MTSFRREMRNALAATLFMSSMVGPVKANYEAHKATEYSARIIPSELINPYEGVVFNQRCAVWIDNNIVVFDCVEDWAEALLPGGCESVIKGRLSSSTCNSASTSFIINDLVPPDTIQRILGVPGITPYELVNYVYRNLPDGQGFSMSCAGAGIERIRPAFEMFGLKVIEVRSLSWWSLADKTRELKPNQRLLLALIGTNAKGRRFQHYTVVNRVVPNDNPNVKLAETVEFYDSFFYEDPTNPNLETVRFEDSPNITNDPSSPIGKRVDIVGAVIVEAASSYVETNDNHPSLGEVVDEIISPINDVYLDDRFLYIRNELDLNEIYLVEAPVQVGKNRFRVKLAFNGEIVDYYYYSLDGRMPDLSKSMRTTILGQKVDLFTQTDPRWGGKLIQKLSTTGRLVPFGNKACGQTLLAVLLNQANPFELSSSYFPNLKSGEGTYPRDHVRILNENGIATTQLKSEPSIMASLNKGNIVMMQANVNLGLYAITETHYTGHYILLLGFDDQGEVLIYDPFWGVGVTKMTDVDLRGNFTAYELTK